MSGPALLRPIARLRTSFLEAAEEMHAEGRWADVDPERIGTEFPAYVESLLDRSTRAPEGRVPMTVLWWVDGGTWLGRVHIRHHLTDSLRDVGGHIGYEVRPSARRRGHAGAMLRAALPVAAGLGIDPALVTCAPSNEASRRVIEGAGGMPWRHSAEMLRYWVPTTPRPDRSQ